MFESVAPETFERRSKRIFYETLPLSIAVHGLAIALTVIVSVWNVVFPDQSPRVTRPYSLVTLPDPPPPPPPPNAPPTPKVTELPKATLLLANIVAPTVIPDTIPQFDPPPPDPPPPAPVVAPASDVGGSPEGQLGGELGGKLHGVPGGIAFPDDGRVHIERSQHLPLQAISQDYPIYPSEGKKKQLEDEVVVRYVIGKNGRVIDIQIIDHARDPIFDQATLDAIKEWRFRPLIKDGKPVEVVHELAVNFVLVRH